MKDWKKENQTVTITITAMGANGSLVTIENK
jgi:hypothetical protein